MAGRSNGSSSSAAAPPAGSPPAISRRAVDQFGRRAVDHPDRVARTSRRSASARAPGRRCAARSRRSASTRLNSSPACDASFKQGSRFDGWVDGDAGRLLSPPVHAAAGDGAARPGRCLVGWRRRTQHLPNFADLAGRGLRSVTSRRASAAMPPYPGALNYAYHLDAAKLAALLARHAVRAARRPACRR